jgi:16S rRNA (cytosine1402-N4)-methyltransferase
MPIKNNWPLVCNTNTKTKSAMHKDENQIPSKHVPVLLDEVMQCLDPQVGESYLDLTAGYGGHASVVLKHTREPKKAVLVDRDSNAIKDLTELFGKNGTEILHQDFLGASQALETAGAQFDLILADLGVSSPHLNEANRGFAISQDGPLDMRMDQTQTLSADTIVNEYSETELADIIWRYGEEPKARQIARLITGNRPIHTTSELALIVARAWPGRSRVHPATRTFQALRIAVNDELQMLEQSIPIWLNLLAPQGRIAIISFHSLEDAIVKKQFSEVSGDRYDATLTLLTKRPLSASPHELVFNPRARSAKLRAAVKK